MAAELKPYNVHALTLYPGAGITEVTAFPGGETPIFTGRAVAALLNKATNDDNARMTGKVVQTSELAVKYDFTDVNGTMPEGDFSGVNAAKIQREIMSKPLIQYDMDAELPDPSATNNTGISGLFAGAKKYSGK